MIDLQEKLYTSTEVAEILGVSLRSVYRYLEEDKLVADVKTATGRHRFSKKNIMDFLYPNGIPDAKSEIVAEPKIKTEKVQRKPVDEIIDDTGIVAKKTTQYDIPEKSVQEETNEEDDEPIDWLAKFREAAAKFKEEEEQKQVTKSEEEVEVEDFTGLSGIKPAEEEIKAPKIESPSMGYYKSGLGGLKDIAQNVDKNARGAGLDYAFTLSAGLSLYKPIKPFSLLHTYVRSKDREFYERVLKLSPSDEANSQLCLMFSDTESLYNGRDELHGLYVVSKAQLMKDIHKFGDDTLISESGSILE